MCSASQNEQLKVTYDKIVGIIHPLPCEPFDVIQTVDDLRRYWRPKRIKVVLLGESHVFTVRAEHQAVVTLDDKRLPDYPRNFVRFVYCLGYGENETLDRRVGRNSGTWQYWKIFYACRNFISRNRDFAPILKRFTNWEDRVAAKIALLSRLRAAGVWLVDASIAGIYRPGAKRPDSRTVSEVIRCSWTGYVRRLIEEADPDFVICIGKGVGRLLEQEIRDLMGDKFEVFPQPQARQSAEEQLAGWKRYFGLCEKYARNDKGSMS